RVTDCPALGTRLGLASPDGGETMAGYVDHATDVGDGWFRVRGWALEPAIDSPPLVQAGWPFDQDRCLVLVDEQGIVAGIGLGGEDRPDVAAHFGRTDGAYGWVAFARKPTGADG